MMMMVGESCQKPGLWGRGTRVSRAIKQKEDIRGNKSVAESKKPSVRAEKTMRIVERNGELKNAYIARDFSVT